MKKCLIGLLGTAVLYLTPLILLANTITTPMYLVAEKGHGKSIGTVTFTDTPHGLLIQTQLSELTPGNHGFHVHTNPNCTDNGNSAGGHLDPMKTGKHEGPYGHGHLGDLPVLWANQAGEADETLIAPHLTTSDIAEHSLMIHAGGDNYSDQPKALGGGGTRVACGVIPNSKLASIVA